MITFSTHRKGNEVTVHATCTITSSITLRDMPCMEEAVIQATLESYMQRGLAGFHQAAGKLNKSADPSLPAA